MKNNQRTRVDVRMSIREKEYLVELAKTSGYTVSEYIRMKLFGRKITVRYLDLGKGQREIKEI